MSCCYNSHNWNILKTTIWIWTSYRITIHIFTLVCRYSYNLEKKALTFFLFLKRLIIFFLPLIISDHQWYKEYRTIQNGCLMVYSHSQWLFSAAVFATVPIDLIGACEANLSNYQNEHSLTKMWSSSDCKIRDTFINKHRQTIDFLITDDRVFLLIGTQ